MTPRLLIKIALSVLLRFLLAQHNTMTRTLLQWAGSLYYRMVYRGVITTTQKFNETTACFHRSQYTGVRAGDGLPNKTIQLIEEHTWGRHWLKAENYRIV